MLNSPVDIALLFGIALLVFGPKKLPELGKSLGQGIGNFKRHLTDAQEEVKTAMSTEPKQAEVPAQNAAKAPASESRQEESQVVAVGSGADDSSAARPTS